MSGFHSFLQPSLFKDLTRHIFGCLGANIQSYILQQSLIPELLPGNLLTVVWTLGQGAEI